MNNDTYTPSYRKNETQDIKSSVRQTTLKSPIL